MKDHTTRTYYDAEGNPIDPTAAQKGQIIFYDEPPRSYDYGSTPSHSTFALVMAIVSGIALGVLIGLLVGGLR